MIYDFRIGVDPGMSGALALLESNSICVDCIDMPTMAMASGRRQVNAAEVVKIITKWREHAQILGYGAMPVYIERVAAMPGQGVSSMFNFGVSYGVVQGVVLALGMPLHLITPQVWKKKAGLIGKDKDYARTLAQQLFPAVRLGLKKDIGKADAILIARFGA